MWELIVSLVERPEAHYEWERQRPRVEVADSGGARIAQYAPWFRSVADRIAWERENPDFMSWAATEPSDGARRTLRIPTGSLSQCENERARLDERTSLGYAHDQPPFFDPLWAIIEMRCESVD